MPLRFNAIGTCFSLFVLVTMPLVAAGLTTAGRQFLDANCSDCHDADERKGGFNFEQLDAKHAGPDQLGLMVRLFDRTLGGEMPPKKKPQPTPEERKAFLVDLGTTLLAKETELAGASGRTSVRRMNRTEYENTLRDLLGLPLLRVKESLPEDGQQFGFDKVAGALDISHIQMTKYLQSADRALRKALVATPTKPESKTWREAAVKQGTLQSAIAAHCAAPLKGLDIAPGLSTSLAGNPRDDFGNCYRAAHFSGEADSVAVLTGVIGAHQPEGIQIDRFNPPSSGWYKVKFSTWGLRWERNKAVPAVRGLMQNFDIFTKPPFQNEKGQWMLTALPQEKQSIGASMQNVEFYGKTETTEIIRASLKGQVIGFYDAPSLKPKVHELTIWLNPGESLSFHAMTLPSSGANNWPTSNGVATYEGPGVAYDWFEVTGPINDQWPPASQRSLFGETMPTGNPSAEERGKLLESFATRAFRRPVTADELTPYAAIVAAEVERGTQYDEAMFAGYKAILCSPDFLFIGLESGVPPRSTNGRARLGDYALASRLSYFLWNSMPDSVLLDLAAKKTLAEPATLQAQVERMLADPRSERFVEHFTDEWLELKKIDFTTPDPALYPEFDPWLHDSMLEESRATFRRLLTQNRSVRELVSSDTILINQRLAELYGIHDVNGAELREVKVPAGSPRGGFLTQAAVLKVTANGTATSPVLRGVWVMERLLGIPRQPPPPNIPAVEPDATGAVTIRQMIEKHRADAACASCHAKMDPPGLALEGFDVIGGLRDRYRLAGDPKKDEPSVEIFGLKAWQNRSRIRLGSAVDASGELADGQKFTDLQSYRTLLLKDEDALARNVARQLIIYATGAGIRFSDRDAIEGIIAKTKPGQHGFRTVVREVVASELFQTK
jgi:Protein of unknown function (DUF1592)/Protein of unknown function (DUF1588)/Protein of unknown function (DUF1587)/Protein of unknown function (DUF1595)/Protein of unknown function (DUF1585)/Planctomycete cytochrome C